MKVQFWTSILFRYQPKKKKDLIETSTTAMHLSDLLLCNYSCNIHVLKSAPLCQTDRSACGHTLDKYKWWGLALIGGIGGYDPVWVLGTRARGTEHDLKILSDKTENHVRFTLEGHKKTSRTTTFHPVSFFPELPCIWGNS